MPPATSSASTVALLLASNDSMVFAWYGRLKHLSHQHWLLAAPVSRVIALFEYLMLGAAQRIGYVGGLPLARSKVAQERVAPAVFVPFAVLYKQQPLRRDCLCATLCLVGAVYFIFRS